MMHQDVIKTQIIQIRKGIAELVREHRQVAGQIPTGWKNNLHWHVGHLVITPQRLTLGLLGKPLGVPDQYSAWFGHGSSPTDWKEGEDIPDLDQLLDELTSTMEPIFDLCRESPEAPYPKPITTGAGITIANPTEGILMSHLHDGIHVGMVNGMIKALGRG